jgi:NAD(P)-dependent dehydrogenase (short-subunit alcohol dehydrogenase family)
MTKGAVLTMTYWSPATTCRTESAATRSAPHACTHLVDGYLAKNYPGRERDVRPVSRTQPIGRMGQPDEIAELALFLCSDAASFITGSNVPIDGGFVTLKM